MDREAENLWHPIGGGENLDLKKELGISRRNAEGSFKHGRRNNRLMSRFCKGGALELGNTCVLLRFACKLGVEDNENCGKN